MRTLDPNSSRPLSRQIADAVTDALAAGELVGGDQLPSHAWMREHFGVSHGTVIKAIDMLRASGIVVTRQGSGAFVRTDVEPPEPEASVLKRLDARLTRIEATLERVASAVTSDGVRA